MFLSLEKVFSEPRNPLKSYRKFLHDHIHSFILVKLPQNKVKNVFFRKHVSLWVHYVAVESFTVRENLFLSQTCVQYVSMFFLTVKISINFDNIDTYGLCIQNHGNYRKIRWKNAFFWEKQLDLWVHYTAVEISTVHIFFSFFLLWTTDSFKMSQNFFV